MITVRNERHGHDARVEQLSALLQRQCRAVFSKMARDIAHGDRALQRWREAAAGDLADLIALAVEDKGALAHRLAPFDFKANPLLRRSILELGKDSQGSGKASLSSATLVDGEGQAGHDRRGASIKIVAVQREARFKPKGIASAETDRLRKLMGADRVGEFGSDDSRDRDLEPVFPGVA